jgi:protein-L-isoaspartate(D-aspartate) O-methyltransferase
VTERRSTFPLPLSSVTGPDRRQSGTSPAPARSVATPQTATRNASSQPRETAPGAHPQYGYKTAPAVAAPSKSHSQALQRAQAAQPQVARPDLMTSAAIRHAMVGRVAKQGVQDQTVLGALDTVPRHVFIEPAMSAQAYVDASLPIGHQQTISQPYIVARMIEVMRNGRQLGKVLEIGTGCGYQAAVLSCVAREVYSIERIKPLHELAKTNLRPLRIANLRLHYGDGMLGLPQVAPFDGIILAAAGLEVPRALLEQLAIGGRLVAPVGAQVQHLQLITRSGKAEWLSETLEACHFVPLRPGTV